MVFNRERKSICSSPSEYSSSNVGSSISVVRLSVGMEQQQQTVVSSTAAPFQLHVGTTALLQSCVKSPPVAKANLGSLVELRDLLKIGKTREVKSFVRENDWPVHHPIRSHVWTYLCQHHDPDAMEAKGFYSETVDQVFGRNQLFLAVMRSQTLGQCLKETKERPDEYATLPSFVDHTNLHTYYLSEKGRVAVRRVICVLGYTHPDITYCPGLYSLASIFLHYASEEDSYNGLCVLVRSRQGKFLHQTKLGYESAWRTVLTLTKKHAKASFVHLGKFVKTSDQVEKLFENWYWWIFKHLPFAHLVRIIDCYLYEGKKVLYRVAMAIVILFAKHSGKPECHYYQDAQRLGLRFAVEKFCREMPVVPTKLLKVAFGIRGLSQKNISTILLRIEMGLKSKLLVSGPAPPIQRSFSSEGLPTSQSQIDIHTSSHTLTVRELLTLWSWLPARITMYQPNLIYTTEEHGCSLMTFYSRVQNYEPTLIIIKTTANEIFGAYCSSKWAERNTKGESGQKRTYFGTGETFIFTICPEMKKYPWVGLTRDGAGSSATKHSTELYMAGDNHMITIGGGDGQAIWIDENIRFGGTGPCNTFANPPLSASQDFQCKVLEVIGFT